MKCLCHSGKRYAVCCQPYHKGKSAPTPVALMRSRYAAFALGKVGYIIKTTHPDSPHKRHDLAGWRKELKAFYANFDFVGLQILEAGEDTVKFHALLTQNGQDASFTEHSLFGKVRGRWLYLHQLK